MAISKVIFNGDVLMDVTQDTVASNNLLSGNTATGADGVRLSGAYIPPTPSLQAKSVTPTESQQIITADEGYINAYSNDSDSGSGSGTSISVLSVRNQQINLSQYAYIRLNGVLTVSYAPSYSMTITFNNAVYDQIASANSYIDLMYAHSGVSFSGSLPDAKRITLTRKDVTTITPNYTYYPLTVVMDLSATVSWSISNFRVDFSNDSSFGEGYDGLSQVTIAAIPSSYVGSGVPTVNGSTIIPTTASQIAVSSGRYTNGSVYVGAIPSNYIVPTGDFSISSNGTYDVSAFANAVVDVDGGGGLYQSKTVYPANNESTILPDRMLYSYSSFKSPATTNSTSFQPFYFTYAASSSCYVRLNGHAYLSFTSGPAMDVYFSNAIIDAPAKGEATYVYQDGSSIPNQNISYSISGAIPAMDIGMFRPSTNNYWQFKFMLSAACSATYGANNSPDNFTVEIHDNSTFTDYDALSQVTVKGLTDVGAVVMSDITEHRLISDWIDSTATYIGSSAMQGINARNVVVPYASYVGSDAFLNNPQLRTISIPIATELRSSAFKYATNLNTVYFPEMLTINASAFDHCYSLSSLIGGSKVTSIGAYAFYAASALTSISFPSVQSISEYTFGYCSKLSDVYMPGLISIYSRAFTACTSLESLYLPSLTTIGSTTAYGSSAFQGCTKLDTVNLPELTTALGLDIFQNCPKLTTFIAPKLNYIQQRMFSGDTSLTTLSVGSSLSSIGSDAFRNCSALSNIDLTKVVYVYTQAFNGTPITSFNFPSVATVQSGLFKSNGTVLKAEFPVATICSSQAFDFASNLSVVCFRSAVTSFHSYAFRSCYNLLSLYLLGSSMTTLANMSVFISCPMSNYTTSTGGVYGSIYVPSSLYDSYVAATNWKTISARFVSMTDTEIANLVI